LGAASRVLADLGNLLWAVVAILSAWATSALVCVGLGLAGYRALGTRSFDADRLLMAFWVGLALALWALQIWHFFLPVSGLTALVLLTAGIVSLAWNRRLLGDAIARSRSRRLAVVALACMSIWLADHSLRTLQHFDTGLYLLGAMKWINSYAIVPGLGNLHLRFAFNNAHLLYAALFDLGPWAGRVPHLVNGSLLIVFLAQSGVCAARLLGSSEKRAGDVFGVWMALPAMLLARIYLVSLSTDLPTTLLAMLVAWRCFRILLGEARGDERTEFAVLVLLSATAVCVKLSVAPFAGGLCLAAALAVRADIGRSAWRVLRLAFGVGCLVMAPWLIRGVFLSGSPFFPSGFVSFPVDWRLPDWAAGVIRDAVLGWARVPGAPLELSLKDAYWLESWAGRHLRYGLDLGFPLPLTLTALGTCASAVGGSLGRSQAASRGLGLLIPGLVACVFWFYTGPDPRFAIFVFWSMAAASLAVALSIWGLAEGRRLAAGCVVIAAGLVIAAAPHDLVAPGAEGGFPKPPTLSTAETETFETNSGLVVNIPLISTRQCWDAPLPCAPRRSPELRLRRPGNLAAGFAWGSVPRSNPANAPGGQENTPAD